MGLAAVLGIVRGHQGSLVVEGKVGHGKTFRLYFPAKKGDTLTVASPTRLADIAPSTSKGVLLIDDEESMREFGTDVLQTQGISVLTAASRQVGLELFKLQRENISLIVLDALIAGLASEETLVKLREIDTSIPIIVASVHTDRASESELLRKGATSFLSKPFTADRFLEEIQQHSL